MKDNDRKVFNRPEHKELRRLYRTGGTTAEAVLWTALKAKRLDGWRWRRQFSVGDFILDFYCPKAKLCVELDGKEHFSIHGSHRDNIRSEFLSRFGIRVLRFENRMVREMPERVLDAIRDALDSSVS